MTMGWDNREVKVNILHMLSSVKNRVIFTRKIAKNRNWGIWNWILQGMYNKPRAISRWDQKIYSSSLQWAITIIREICNVVD